MSKRGRRPAPAPAPAPTMTSRRSAAAGAVSSLSSTLSPTISTEEESANDDDNEDESTSSRQRRQQQPEPPTKSSNNNNHQKKKGGISMSISELAQKLGGTGRARLAWDCYSIGVDPALFYGSVIRLGYDDYETVYELLPTSRRTDRMGDTALQLLADLYHPNNNDNDDSGSRRCVEGGVASLSYISQSRDRTTKLLLKLSDGLEIETVIIPALDGERSTLCISSQVGCRQGCTFCATGRMGKLRSLTSDEILAQMFYAQKICRLYELPAVTNVVFMGMGEPADNVAAVNTACDILTDRELFQLSATKVTVSTVAPTPAAFMELSASPCTIAWSVHSANDSLRQKLVPTTKYSIEELKHGLIDALQRRPPRLRATMLEVALVSGINDSVDDADAMAKLARDILDAVPGCKLIVNVIPLNDIGSHLPYEKPDEETVFQFKKQIQQHNIYTYVRTTRGDDESAACGQLATTKNNKKNRKK